MLWYLKQLLPLTYVSQYGEIREDEAGNRTETPMVTVWRVTKLRHQFVVS